MNQSASDPIFIDETAAWITRLGLRTPVLLALGAGHPVTFLSSQLLWVAQPVLALFVPSGKVAQTAHLLEAPESVQALMARLEAEEA
jgi:hypothetical protein